MINSRIDRSQVKIVKKDQEEDDIFFWLESQHQKQSGRNTINGNMVINEDFKELIKLPNANGVKYLVVGGYVK